MTADDLRMWRKAFGFSQGELGRLLGVPQPTISRWESGAIAIEHPAVLARALRDIERQHKRRRAAQRAQPEGE